MRSASSSGEGDSDRVSHPKRLDASEENCGNLSRCREQIADRGRHREQRGVLTDKTGDLRPSGRPSIESSGSDTAGIPSMEAGTLKTGLPVEPSPTGAAPGAARIIAAS